MRIEVGTGGNVWWLRHLTSGTGGVRVIPQVK